MNPIAVFLTVACLAVGAVGATGHLYAGIPVVIAAIVIASALKMATVPRRRWRRIPQANCAASKGPDCSWSFRRRVDERIQTAAFSHDAQKAALNITNYREAIDRVSQTSLRVAETS
jgi:hypothetical protein